MAELVAPAVVVPLYVQLGDGQREHLGDVTVAVDTRGTVGAYGRYEVALGLADPALVTDQVATLLEHAATALRTGDARDATA